MNRINGKLSYDRPLGASAHIGDLGNIVANTKGNAELNTLAGRARKKNL